MLRKFFAKNFYVRPNLIVLFLLTWFVKENYATRARLTNRIIGGRPARHGRFPYMVSIGEKEGVHFCGGCIIDKLNIITAAHCFPQEPIEDRLLPEDLRIITGAVNVINPEKDAQYLDLRAIIIHQMYDFQLKKNDIAIMRVKKEIHYGKYVQPIPIGTTRPKPGTECTVAGWGVTKSGNKGGSPLLMSTHVKVYEFDHCFKTELGNVDRHTQICAGEVKGGHDSCQGDSGGPLICNGKTHGVISFGHDCGLVDFPAIYTDITKYTDFIKNGRAWNGSTSNSLLRVLTAKDTKNTAGNIAKAPNVLWLLLRWIAFVILSTYCKSERKYV